MADRRGILIILSSPSGAGKSTLSRRLMKWDPTVTFSVSATTRSPRKGEIDGQDYHFLSEADFKRRVAEGSMLEHALVFGNYYGSLREPVEEATSQGRDVIFDIDWQGAQQILNSTIGRRILSIFILPPSIFELKKRLESRGQDTPAVIANRMKKSWDEISHWAEYEYVLVNDDLDETERKLRSIVEAARLLRIQQPSLSGHVKNLQYEFQEFTQ